MTADGQRWVVLAGLIGARFTFGFHMQALVAVSDGFTKAHGLSHTDFGVLIGMLLAPGLVVAFLGGALAQRLGDRAVIVISLCLMLAAAVIPIVAGGYWPMFVSRLLSGAGSVMITVSSTKVVVDWFQGRESNTAIALALSGYPLGIALAMAILGPFSTPTDWSIAYWITGAVTLAALVGFLATYRDSPNQAALAESAARPNRPEVIQALRIGWVWASVNGGFLITLGFAPAFLIDHGADAVQAGILVGFAAIASIPFIPLGGFLADRFNWRSELVYGGSFAWAAMMLVVVMLADWPLWAGLALAAASMASAPAAGPIVSAAGEIGRPEVRARIFGIFYSVFYAGSVIAPALAGWVIDSTGTLTAGMLLVPAILVTTVLMYRVFMRRHRQATHI